MFLSHHTALVKVVLLTGGYHSLHSFSIISANTAKKTYTAKNLLGPLHYCCRRGGSNISYFDIHAQSYGKLMQYNGH